MPNECIIENCLKHPLYSNTDDFYALYCEDHKESQMICYYQKKCKYEICNNIPYYNFTNNKKPLYCEIHKLNDMEDVVNRKCLECNNYPAYNFIGLEPIYCELHTKENMENLLLKKCNEQDCKEYPLYNYANEIYGIKCKMHKLEKMVNIVHQECLICEKKALFNNINEKKGLYCSKHKLKNMYNVENKLCLKCDKYAYYNYIHLKELLYCKQHKLENMIDITKIKKCIINECSEIAMYNFENKTTPILCENHKNICMEKKLYCINDGCENKALYNYKGNTQALFCKNCKKDDMINVKIKKCIIENCYEYAQYNYANNPPIYCENHKLDKMLLVNRKLCKLCNYIHANYKYDKYCFGCFCYLNPDLDIPKKRLFKQNTITNDILKYIHKICKNKVFYNITIDKIIKTSCSSHKRCDILVELPTHNLIIEIDENQHKQYGEDCEKERINQLLIDLGMQKLNILRFNPDKYTKKNITCQGMFLDKINKLEINEDEYNKRIKKFKTYIKKYVDNYHKEEILQIKYLYYDNKL